MLVVDTSGSMNEEQRLPRAKLGLEAFFHEVSPQDRLGLTIFSNEIQPLVRIAPFRTDRAALRASARNLIADGGTAVWDATLDAFRRVRSTASDKRISAVVVLTDGEDTDSNATADDVVRAVRAQGDSSERVRIFTIAYSASAEGAARSLQAIARASGGQPYQGDTEDIEAVYRSISSFF
jgi:Ca-activated chloride channel family protein